MSKNYLTEAFKKLDILDEDVFDVDDGGIAKLKEFEDGDIKDGTVQIIDPEADDEEELEDNYIGKVILDCSVCHSKIYKNKEDVTTEDGLANVGDECPFCYSPDGFKVIGEVAEFHDDEDVDVGATEDGEKVDVDIDVDETEEEKKEESLRGKKSVATKGLKESDKPAATSIKDAQKWVDYDMKKYGKISQRTNDLVKKAGFQIVKDDHGDYEVAAGKYESKKTVRSPKSVTLNEGARLHKTKRAIKEGYRGSQNVEMISHGSWADPDLVYNGYTFNYWDIEDALWGDFLEETGHKDSESDDPAVEKEFNEYVQNTVEGYLDDVIAGGYFDGDSKSWHDRYNESRNIKKEGKLTEAPSYELSPRYDARQSFYRKARVDTGDKNDQNKLYSYDTLVAEMKDGKPVVYGTFSQTTLRHIKEWLKQNGFRADNGNQIMADYGVKEESLGESLDGITIDTGDQEISVTAQDKETVEDESEADAVADETIKPLTSETETEIEDNNVDVDVDEFDDEAFDGLGEGYLKKAYSNVASYKTTNVSSSGNKLKLEGIITFGSGAKKKTSFIFESKDITKSGKARFIGENLQICKGRKAFTITGTLSNKKFMPESLNYNYKAKDSVSGISKRVYGTISKKN